LTLINDRFIRFNSKGEYSIELSNGVTLTFNCADSAISSLDTSDFFINKANTSAEDFERYVPVHFSIGTQKIYNHKYAFKHDSEFVDNNFS